MEKGQIKRKFHSYTLEFKLEAVCFVTSGNSKEEAARKYGVDCKRIREWCKNKDKLKDSCEAAHNAKRRRLDSGGRPPSFETLEESLYSWIEELRSQRLRVTRKMVQGKGSRTLCWRRRILRSKSRLATELFGRHNITLRRRTTVGQKIPETVIPKLMNYIIFVRSQILRNRYQLSHIGAMDETPIWFDMPVDTTVDLVGQKSIPIRTTGHEKSRITVCLAAKANGIKLPPFIVFKGKRRDRDLNELSGVVCVMSSNGWMDEKLTHEWLQTVWGGLSFGRRLLVWNSFRCHIQR